MPKLIVVGWDRTVDSNDLFKYLISDSFDSDLADALKINIELKGQKRIQESK